MHLDRCPAVKCGGAAAATGGGGAATADGGAGFFSQRFKFTVRKPKL